MKKLFIAAIAVFGFTTANAQYTAEKGDLQTSVDFRPFNNGGQEMFENVGINVSYFLADKHAIRVGLNFGLESQKDTKKNTEFGFTVGYENHFKSYDRVDLYAGVQAGLDFKSAKTPGMKSDGSVVMLKDASNSNTAFGVGVFTGINFYVYKKLYVGAEIGFNFKNTSYKKGESLNSKDEVVTDPEAAPSKSELNFAVNPALRLGWTF